MYACTCSYNCINVCVCMSLARPARDIHTHAFMHAHTLIHNYADMYKHTFIHVCLSRHVNMHVVGVHNRQCVLTCILVCLRVCWYDYLSLCLCLCVSSPFNLALSPPLCL